MVKNKTNKEKNSHFLSKIHLLRVFFVCFIGDRININLSSIVSSMDSTRLTIAEEAVLNLVKF